LLLSIRSVFFLCVPHQSKTNQKFWEKVIDKITHIVLYRLWKGVSNLPTRNIEFPEGLYEKLKEVADDMGIAVSAVIKIACDEYVKNRGK